MKLFAWLLDTQNENTIDVRFIWVAPYAQFDTTSENAAREIEVKGDVIYPMVQIFDVQWYRIGVHGELPSQFTHEIIRDEIGTQNILDIVKKPMIYIYVVVFQSHNATEMLPFK